MAKVMIVDDEEDLRELVSAVLKSEGFDVVAVSSGRECLDAVEKERPDLVLMDMMMPGISGRETVEKLRQNHKTKELKVIFLTVCQFSEIGKETLDKLDVVDYITKPFDNDDLVERVKNPLSRTQTL